VPPEPIVSVIIPVYNGEKTLKMCLDSVLEQTYKNYEVIVVDNNSTDRTKEIICNLKEDYDRIKYIFSERRTTGSARNEGVKAAEGEVVVFTDSDCICPHNWIEKITMPIRLEGEIAAVGFEDDPVNNYWTRNIQKSDESHMRHYSHGGYITIFDTKNAAIRAQVLKKLMFDPDINISDDLDLAVRIIMENRIRYIPSVRVCHFHRTSLRSTVKTYFLRAFWSFRISRKYKKVNCSAVDTMFENMSLKRWIVFPFWVLFQFTKRPPGEAYFIFVSEFSWRAGLLWSIIKGY
jgi:glycosyltransferase involved in cell wall biosynthesis